MCYDNILCVGSALLVQLQWAMREPRSVERVIDQISTLFYIVIPKI